MTHVRAKLGVAGLVLAAAVGYLAYAGITRGQSYYLEVDSFLADAEYHKARVKVHGKVAREALVADPAASKADFVLLGKTGQLKVAFRGTIPDTFEAGREVVVDGRLDGQGVFQADKLMTKCASKYASEDCDTGGSE